MTAQQRLQQQLRIAIDYTVHHMQVACNAPPGESTWLSWRMADQWMHRAAIAVRSGA